MPGTGDTVLEALDEKCEVPRALLSNLGKAEARDYSFETTCGLLPRRFFGCNFLTGLQGVGNGNRQQYALENHIEVMEASGWKVKMYPPVGTRVGHIVAEAV